MSARFAAVDRAMGSRSSMRCAAARPRATISFDPNIRPFVTPDREAVRLLVERQVSLARMVKASQEDLEWLYPGRSVEESLSAWTKVGAAILRRDARGTRRGRHSGQGTN